MKRMAHEVLNDGFIQYGVNKTERSEKGTRTGSAFKSLGTLAYKEMSCRDEDYKLAEVMSSTLDIKIRTLYPPNLRNANKNKLKIMLNGTTYDVIKVDTDREKMYLYFYLQEVGEREPNNGQDESTD